MDPFLGSGTTAVAAVLHERKYSGIELNKAYFREAKKMLKKYKES